MKNIFIAFKKLVVICLLTPFILFSLNAQDLNPSQQPHLKGYWKFQNASNLTKATVGNDLILVGNHQWVNGPQSGDTASRIAIGSYYKCYHQIAANGGGNMVNRYTLMYDFKILSLANWHTFHQTDTTNTNDGECFIRPNSSSTPGAIGVGYTGYSNTLISPGKWYRLVISVNLGHYYRYYLNGTLIHDGDTTDIDVDARFALTPLLLFFADNNQEDDTIDIASLAIFDTCLTDTQIAAIGTCDPCILNPVVAKLGNDTTFCEGGSITLSAPSGMKKYFWSGTQGNQNLTVNQTKEVVLQVEDNRGCLSSPDTMNIKVLSIPRIDLGKDTAFCDGNSKILNPGNNFAKYFWSDLDSSPTKTISQSDTVWVKVMDSMGCWSKPDTIIIKVNPLPVVNLGNDTAICDGSTITLNAGPNFKKYFWSNNTSQQTLNVSSAGTYGVYVVDFNNCQSQTDSINITVHQLPVISLGKDTSFCDGDSLLLDLGSGFKNYVWSNGFKGQKQAIYQTIYLTARIQDAKTLCWSKDDDININVFSLPVKNLGPDREICEGLSATLDVGSYFNEFQWSNNFQGKMLEIFTSDTIWLKVKDPVSGCWSKADTVIIAMLPAPVVNLGENKSLCEGDSLELDAGNNFLKYQWSDGKNVQKRWIYKNANLWVKVQGQNQCWSRPDTISIVFHPNPIIHLSLDTGICEGDSLLLDAGNGYHDYIWGDGYFQQQRLIRKALKTTIYVIDIQGCKSNTDSIRVEIFPLPQPFLGNDTTITLKDTLILSPGNQFVSYLWQNGSDDPFYQLVAAESDTGIHYYFVKVSNQQGCENSDTIKIRIFDPGSVADLINGKILIYPNPASDLLYVYNLSPSLIINTIECYDLSGKKVLSIKQIKNQTPESINIESLSKGEYILLIRLSDGKMLTIRFNKL